MSSWSRTQGKVKSININHLNLEVMSTQEAGAKEAPKTSSVVDESTKGKAAVKAAKPAKADKEAKAKAKAEKSPKAAKAKASKGPGVIASIKEFVEAGPVKESALVKKLGKRFPDKDESSMLKTVKAQIGSNKRPVRMERELQAKGIKWTLTTVVDEKSKEKTYSAKVK